MYGSSQITNKILLAQRAAPSSSFLETGYLCDPDVSDDQRSITVFLDCLHVSVTQGREGVAEREWLSRVGRIGRDRKDLTERYDRSRRGEFWSTVRDDEMM